MFEQLGVGGEIAAIGILAVILLMSFLQFLRQGQRDREIGTLLKQLNADRNTASEREVVLHSPASLAFADSMKGHSLEELATRAREAVGALTAGAAAKISELEQNYNLLASATADLRDTLNKEEDGTETKARETLEETQLTRKALIAKGDVIDQLLADASGKPRAIAKPPAAQQGGADADQVVSTSPKRVEAAATPITPAKGEKEDAKHDLVTA